MTNLLRIENLSVHLGRNRERRPLLRGINLELAAGNILGLVGESGAGKSMTARAVLGTLPPDATITAGRIYFNGQDITHFGSAERRPLYGSGMALIPQDPLSALNPAHRIGRQLDAVIARAHLSRGRQSRRDRDSQALALLADVQIRDSVRVLNQYPHELSGGMRQRILIAMAFAAAPRLIIADEPTTALDVAVQKHILRIIRGMQRAKNTAILFVTHDLGVVAKMADAVAVLYDGMIVETAPAAQLFKTPKAAYTRALLRATPRYDRPAEILAPVSDDIYRDLQSQIHAFDRRQSGSVRL